MGERLDMSEQAGLSSSSNRADQAVAIVPPRIYRVMKADGPFPALGNSGSVLGARIPKDIQSDAHGLVHPKTGGMSVRPSLSDIPFFLLPKRLRHLNRDAGGSNNNIVWMMGQGPFISSPVTPDLELRPDRPDHGLLEPAAKMSVEYYQQALWATQKVWINGEP